jgi:hypothetical protein
MSILMLKNKVHAFPALAEAAAIGDGEPAFGTRLVIDPKDGDVALIEKALKDVAIAKWKEDGEAVLAMLIEDGKVAFERKPYRSKKTGKVYEGFEGKFNLGTRNAKTQPSVFNPYGEAVFGKSAIEQPVDSGCRGNAKVELAVAKGKREYDKRQTLRERQDKREADRAIASRKNLNE